MTRQAKLGDFRKKEIYEATEDKEVQGPYELPEGWRWVKLEDVAEIIMGQSPPSTTYNRNGAGLPFYQGKADFGEKYPVPRIWCSEPSKIAEANDVLISVRAPVGPVNLCREKSCIGRGLAAIRTKNHLNNFFLFYYLRSIENKWVGKGSTFEAIKKKDLENLLIPLPPLEEQERIVSRLNELVSRAEEAKRLRKQAREEAEKIMQAALNKVFSRAEEGWKWVKLKEIVDIRQETLNPQDYPDEEFELYSIPAYHEKGKPEIKVGKEIKSTKIVVQPYDCLFGKLNPHLPKVWLVEPFKGRRQITSTELFPLIPKKENIILINFLFWFLRTPYFTERMVRKVIGTTGSRKRLSKNDVLEEPIPLLPLEEQKIIVSYLDKTKVTIESLEKLQQKTEEELEKLVPAILDKAFRGEL
ncbi:MAG: restriction endonuclease subunit S [Thermoproteota archaeon]